MSSSITIADPLLLAQLPTTGHVEFKDPSGRTIGYFNADFPGKLPAGFKYPFSEVELAKHREELDGRPLTDILRDFETKSLKQLR